MWKVMVAYQDALFEFPPTEADNKELAIGLRKNTNLALSVEEMDKTIWDAIPIGETDEGN
jgi:hypothetical protein